MAQLDLAQQLKDLRDDPATSVFGDGETGGLPELGGPGGAGHGGGLGGLGHGGGGLGGLGGPSLPSFDPFDPKTLKDLLADEQKEKLQQMLKELSEVAGMRSKAGVIDPPRLAIERCLRLVRKLAALREDHRALVAAQLARKDMLEDLQSEAALRDQPAFASAIDHRKARANAAVANIGLIKQKAETIGTRIQNELTTLYSDGRIGVLARAEGDLAQTPHLAEAAHQADAPLEVSVVFSEGENGVLRWAVDNSLQTGSTVAARVRSLTEAMSRLGQIKERIGARIAVGDSEIRKLYLELEALQAQIDQDEAAIAEASRKHERDLIDRNIARITNRAGAFFANFDARIALTVTRYVETAKELAQAGRRLTDACGFHKFSAIAPFDPKLLIDANDASDDDDAIQSYLDAVEEVDRDWNELIGGAVGGLMPAGDFALAPDTQDADMLTVTVPWKAPLAQCFVEGLLIESEAREAVDFAIEVSEETEELNKLGTVLSHRISKTFYSFAVETSAVGSFDREAAILRGGFLANLADGIHIRLSVPANGRASLSVRLYVEAFGHPAKAETSTTEDAPDDHGTGGGFGS
jgi:hypothetical protein